MTQAFHVTLCMATSLDGRINRSQTPFPSFTSRHDRDKLFGLRAEADAIVVGAGTVRRESLPPLVRQKAYQIKRIKAGRPPHPAVVIVSSSLNLPWDSEFFSSGQQVVILTDRTPEGEILDHLQQRHIKWVETAPPLNLEAGLKALASLGFSRFLAEGGGTLAHALFRSHLVSKLHLTLAPFLFAGEDTPTLVRGPEFLTPPQLRLAACDKVGNELHLVYER